MTDGSLEECILEGHIIKISPDKEKAISLKKIALGRINFINKIKLTNHNAQYIFESYYTSLNELLQSIAYLKGYKILNHICLGYFLKDILNMKEYYDVFNFLRKKRNSLVYYGDTIEKDLAITLINQCKKLINILLKEIEKLER